LRDRWRRCKLRDRRADDEFIAGWHATIKPSCFLAAPAAGSGRSASWCAALMTPILLWIVLRVSAECGKGARECAQAADKIPRPAGTTASVTLTEKIALRLLEQ
jgi:hypothetical protein